MSSLAPEHIGQMNQDHRAWATRDDEKQAEEMRSMGRHYSALGQFAARTLGGLGHTSDIERRIHVVDPRRIYHARIELKLGDPAHTEDKDGVWGSCFESCLTKHEIGNEGHRRSEDY